jgi:hypothetical protein
VSPANCTVDFLGPFLSRLKRRIHFGGGILLHPGQNMAVKVECNPHLGMPQPFAGNLGVDTGRQHMSSPRFITPTNGAASSAPVASPVSVFTTSGTPMRGHQIAEGAHTR